MLIQRRLVVAFALIAALPLQGAEKAKDPDVVTHGHLNGWAWTGLRSVKADPPSLTEMYVWGALSALDAVRSDTNGDTNDAAKLARPHMSPAELSLALDQFYVNLLNRPVPIVYAFTLIKLRIEGADPVAVEKIAVTMREDAATKDAK
jgi:hypothetical protein